MTSLILTQAQAQAVYRAMCELNNVCGRLTTTLARKDEHNFTLVFEDPAGFVAVRTVRGMRVSARETYDTQHDFAAAYRLE